MSSDEYTLLERALFKENKWIFNKWLVGKHTSEEINQFVSNHTHIPYERLWSVFVHDCETMHIEKNILNMFCQLRHQFYLVLITGNMDCFDRFTVPALKLHDYFDAIVNSYNEKQLKNDKDGESFLKYLHGNIRDALLLEDSEKNCATFETLGGTAYRVTPETTALHHLEKIQISVTSC